MKPAIEINEISKRFRLGGQPSGYRTLRESLMNGLDRVWRATRGKPQADSTPDSERDMFWALKDVSFEVQTGEVIGIIGRNGSGKSTLLKILSQIYEPTSGRAVVRGRMASLLEVGTGFHPELTGRENIYLNGSILGMSRREIARQFDEIVAFSEIEQFLDTPVKRYSSGMYVRLAFAVAAHLNPDILIVDEVLSVGDVAFQNKCLGKMGDVAKGGRTAIFVSHNMQAVATLCQRAILLRKGRVHRDGPSTDVVRAYLEAGVDQTAEISWRSENAPGNDLAQLQTVRVLNEKEAIKFDHDIANSILLEMTFIVRQPGSFIDASFHVLNKDGLCLFAVGTGLMHDGTSKMTKPGIYRTICRIPANFLNDGRHYVSAFLVRNSAEIFVSENEIVSFQAHDYGTGRGGYLGTFIGAIRPILQWDTTRIGEVE